MDTTDRYREVALRIGSMVLCWGGQEAEGGVIDLSNPDNIEAFINALGYSSVPEACGIVGESLSGPSSTY